jgi:hypothetical protein
MTGRFSGKTILVTGGAVAYVGPSISDDIWLIEESRLTRINMEMEQSEA